jgi:NADPH:quinone reductase-like Zn-dependent oxidoreductase
MAKAAAGRGAREAPAIPATMKAALMKGFGGPETIELGEAPVPRPGPGDILIRVAAAGVGIWDAELRGGLWGAEGPHPLILGSDGAGVVVAVGERVEGFSVGDEVFAYEYLNPRGGFHAEYACVDAGKARRVPSKLSLDQAAAVGTTGVTALAGVEKLRLNQGDTALIFGATGGVGSMAVQFARFMGARVIGTASTEAGRQYLHELGADAVYDARRVGVGQALDALKKDSLDAVLALAGGGGLERALERLAPGGRVAYPNGVEPPPRERPGARLEAYDGVADPKILERLAQLIEGIPEFDARIEAAFPLSQAARAHARVEKGGVLGKVILRIGERRPVETRTGTGL